MKAFIVYCHPSEDSFTRCVRDAFIRGLEDAGHEYVLSDLYKMDFRSDMTEAEYLRDAYYQNTPDIADDVLAEQEKINSSDAIVFIYPVFWSEAPAKLVGWFDRVWTYGFAYGEKHHVRTYGRPMVARQRKKLIAHNGVGAGHLLRTFDEPLEFIEDTQSR